MKILIACERSGVVRDAFNAKGHQAWSCDLLPSITIPRGRHLQFDCVDVLHLGWDMMIAHPPCTYTTYAGAVRWKRPGWCDEQQKALNLFYILLNAPIEKIAIENPRGLPARYIRKPDDQYQPYEFGAGYSKRTYLWLKNLPPLLKYFTAGEFENDWTSRRHGFTRSITDREVAKAMADQWST